MLPHPVLDRVPQGQLIDAKRFAPDWPRVEILFTDEQWRPATIIAWCRCRYGWVALVRWADGSEDWLVYNARYLQRSFDHLGGWSEE
jgi:hypothetical protein